MNFSELAAKDANATNREKIVTSVREISRPRTIEELESSLGVSPKPASTPNQSAGVLLPSAGPSRSFPAQDDVPQAGTGIAVIPPDTTGAVGLDKLFVTLNNNYRIQDKTSGAEISTVSIETFWSSTGATKVFDPRVQYDPYNQRWIVAATSNSGASSSILVGISATSDPQGTFSLYRFTVGCAAGAPNCSANGETDDFPMLGFNKNWIAVSWNQFQITNGAFIAGKVLALDYPSLRSGTSNSTIFTVTTNDNVAAFCMHPATTLSATEEILYFPAHVSSPNATYRLHKLTGTASAPTFSLDSTSRTRPGGGWTQPGGDILPQACVGTPGVTCPSINRFIDSSDSFIRSNVVFRNGSIWYAQTISLNSHTAAQWTRLDVNGSFVDGGRVEDATANSTNGGEWYAYPSITVNVNNDALMGFSNFASIHFARAAYAMRLGSDAVGTMRDPVIIKDGEDYYAKDFGGIRNRWGDYSHSVVDPANDQDFWTIQEYAGTRVIQDSQQTTNTSRWGTWWAMVPPNGPPPSPTPSISPTPAGCPSSLVVTSNADGDDAAPGNRVCATATGACTLRAAIEEANALTSCGTIDISFNNVTSPIVLGITLPVLNHNLNLNGPGANQLVIQRSMAAGTSNFRIFFVNSGRTVNISGLTITNGSVTGFGADGGGILNSGTLTVANSIITGNNSDRGGGIYTNGSFTLLNSTIRNNSAVSFGGGISGLGMRIFNSTISGNTTAGSGGGISFSNSSLTLTNVTISNNRCNTDDVGASDSGGGLNTSGGGATLSNTIIAGNFQGSGTTTNEFTGGGNFGTIVSSSSYNIIGVGGSSGLTNGVNNNQVGVSDVRLGQLASNGGSTDTHALLSGSPALNAGSNSLAVDQNNSALPTDQRGTGFSRVVNGTVDVGAFELQSGEVPPTPTPTPTPTSTPTPTPTPTPAPCLTFTVNNSGDGNDATAGDAICATTGGVCTLRAAIQEANALPGCGTININVLNVPSPIVLGTSLPTINHDLNINGPGANQLTLQRSTVSGTPAFRIFTTGTNRIVSIAGLTLMNGTAGGSDGGNIFADGPLTLININVYGGSALRGGGIFFGSTVGLMNPLTLVNCNIGGLSPGQGNSGWGIYASGKITVIGGSIAGNTRGGVTFSSGPNLLDGVTISGNTSPLEGGGADLWNGATLVNCLVINNSAGRNGGGINAGGTLKVINTTLSGNSAGGSGGAISGSPVQMTNVTVTNNRSDSDNTGNETGGGLSAGVTLTNSLVAGNFRGSGTTPDDIAGPVVVASSSFNLIGTGGSGGLTNGVNNNQVGVANPGLAPLANNGGATLTHALFTGSPAINAGSNALAVDQNGSPLTTDQRGLGFNRIVSNTVDVGAFERGTAPILFADTGNHVIAIDSVTFVRDPFSVAGLHNFSLDQRTRVMIFTSNLGLNQPSSDLSVTAGGIPLIVEAVGPLAGVPDTSYIIVKLDPILTGNVQLSITFRGVSSNTAVLSISP